MTTSWCWELELSLRIRHKTNNQTTPLLLAPQQNKSVIACRSISIKSIKEVHIRMNHNMRFPKMWYVRYAKAQNSLRTCTLWSEPLLIALIFDAWKATTTFRVSILKGRSTDSPASFNVKMAYMYYRKSHIANWRGDMRESKLQCYGSEVRMLLSQNRSNWIKWINNITKRRKKMKKKLEY